MSTPPKGWAETTIGSIAEIKLGKMLDQGKNQGEPTEYLRNVNVRWGRIDTADVLQMRMTASERASLDIRDGDIMVCEGGEPGRSAVWDGGPTRLSFQKALMRMRPLLGISSHLLASYLRQASVSGNLEPHFTGTTIKHLPQQALSRVPIALPPLPEQSRIVAKIDVLSGKSKRARDHLDHVPRLVEKYKQAVLTATFSQFESGAETEPLDKCAEFVTSGSRGWAKYYSDRGAFFIRVGNVARGNVSLLRKDIQHVIPPPSAEGLRTLAQPNDIVITITADLGRVGIVPADLGTAYVNQHVALIRLMHAQNAAFVSWYLTSEYGQVQLLEKNRGATKAGLGLDDIRAVRVPLPPLRIQQEIVRRIEHAFTWIERLAGEATSARKLVDRLDQAVLTKAFRGELVPQDPSDEPASVLLDRIRAERATGSGKVQRRARRGAKF